MTHKSRRSRKERAGPTRYERQALIAMRMARREIAEGQARLQTVEAALAAARSSKRWLEEAKRAVSSGDARFSDHPLDLAQHVIGFREKLSALSATIERLEEEVRIAAVALRDAQSRAIRSPTPMGGHSVQAPAPRPK